MPWTARRREYPSLGSPGWFVRSASARLGWLPELTRRRRRTRQSGPLGELFDHGVDALNTGLEVLIFAGSQNMGQSWYTIATLFACTSLLPSPPSSHPPPNPNPNSHTY